MINSIEIATKPTQLFLLISDRDQRLTRQAHGFDTNPRLNRPSLGFSLTESYFPKEHFFLPLPKTSQREEGRGTLHYQIFPLSKKSIYYIYEAHFHKSTHFPLTIS